MFKKLLIALFIGVFSLTNFAPIAQAATKVAKKVVVPVKKQAKKKEIKKLEPKKEERSAPKGPETKAPEVKAPEVKVPEAKPEMKKEETVTIQNFAFSPVNLTVKKGTVVTWVNQDSARHNAHSLQDGGPVGPLLGQGEKYSYTANKVGSFDYVCDPHAGFMTGKLTVTE